VATVSVPFDFRAAGTLSASAESFFAPNVSMVFRFPPLLLLQAVSSMPNASPTATIT